MLSDEECLTCCIVRGHYVDGYTWEMLSRDIGRICRLLHCPEYRDDGPFRLLDVQIYGVSGIRMGFDSSSTWRSRLEWKRRTSRPFSFWPNCTKPMISCSGEQDKLS